MNVYQLRFIMPAMPLEKSDSLCSALNNAMQEYSIDTPQRRSAFIAQIAHESGQLRFFREFASGMAYEGRQDLGNTVTGDGPKYRGRGALMITGRYMYDLIGHKFQMNLIDHPEILEEPIAALRSAACFWTDVKRLNPLADQDLFTEITHRIVGGYTAADQRLAYWLRARKVENL